jgi:DNA (cytosine-5)-methyltransferase 1
MRSTAWAVVAAAEYHRPRALIIENVPELRGWACYPAWRMALNALGYQLAEHVIDSADHGVPQHRERLFVVGLLGLAAPRLTLPKRAHVPVSAVADFSAGRWALVEKPGRAAATLARVAVGRAEHGDRFAMSYYGSTRGGRSLSRPLGTLTTRDRWALIDGDRMRMLSVPEARDCMGFRRDLELPDDVKLANHLIGNAVAPRQAADVLALALQHLGAA